MAWWNSNKQVEALREELKGDLERQKQSADKVLRDIQLKSGTKTVPRNKVQVAVRGLRRQTPSVSGYDYARSMWDKSNEYKGPVHNLQEIAKAVDVESSFARAVDRQLELTIKQGWRIRGRDIERVRYVKRRVNEIMLVSGTTFRQMIEDTTRDLFLFANHNWVFKRDPERSTGSPIRMHGRKIDPIAGLYAADPVSMKVKQTKTGLIEKWQQSTINANLLSGTSSKKPKGHAARDVLHFYVNRKTGFLFGTPYVVPVLDDMRLLRRLEELTDIIAHKHAFPLMVVKIGTEKQPADEVMDQGGVMVAEVDVARDQVENLDFEGGLVVTERYDIQMIGAENKALDLKPYLEYLEKRVLGGLRLSEIDLGRGDSSNRNTAQSITQTLVDACTRVQRIIEDLVTWKFFFFLLMEGGFKVDLGNVEEELVFLDFPPIDTEEQRSEENHAMGLYEGNVCTEDECRERMGQGPIPDGDREGMFMEKVTKPQSEMETEAKEKVEKTKAANKSKTQPSNQHGKKTTKPKISKNRLDLFREAYLEQVSCHFQGATDQFVEGMTLKPGMDGNIGDEWRRGSRPKGMGALTTRSGYQSARLIHYFRDAETWMTMDGRTYLMPLIDAGFAKAVGHEKPRQSFILKEDLDGFFRSCVRDELKGALQNTGSVLRMWSGPTAPDAILLRSALEIHGQTLQSTALRQTKLAFAFGFLQGARQVGADQIKVIPTAEDRWWKGSCRTCAPREVELPVEAKDLVCFQRGCRVEYAIAGTH